MTDNGHTDHEQLSRALHEQGQAQAPDGLADDVMRDVRAEPRHRERTWLRPVALCAAVAVLLAASIAGLARIDGSGHSSASLSGAAGGVAGTSSAEKSPDAVVPQASAPSSRRRVAHVPVDKLRTLGALPFCPAQAHTYALRVPATRYAAIRDQLQAWAKYGPAGASTFNVLVRRAAASAPLAITCP